MIEYKYSTEKNEILLRTRGITFNQIIKSISINRVLWDGKHPNEEKYPNQWMMIVQYKNYTYCVPYVIDGNTYFLKTIYPSRKKLHLLKKG